MARPDRPKEHAPYTFRNWRAFEAGEQSSEAYEWPLFSEAWFTGEIRGLGPYSILNAVGRAPTGHAHAALVLRGGLYADQRSDGNSRDAYHGGHHPDELAALLSLCTGVRLKAGGQIRSFSDGGDPLGAPRGFGGHSNFVLPEGGLRLPYAVRTGRNPVKLSEGDTADRLRTFPLLEPKVAGVLIKSARLYQDALWLAEEEPHLAWIFLVSAVEAAADQWRRKNRNHVERLADAQPKLVEMLHEVGGDELVARVAKEISGITGATLKFTEFILTFDPGPPPEPRLKMLAVDWENLREAAKKVYKWRSRALHGGSPFPSPMCDPPIRHGNAVMGFEGETTGALAERPLGLAAGTGGAMWDNDETPMLLHVFEHITRGALLNWWASFDRQGGSAEAGTRSAE